MLVQGYRVSGGALPWPPDRSIITGMLLAGDLGGTNTRLGLFRGGPVRPDCVARADYRTLDFEGLPAIVGRFLDEAGTAGDALEAACVGVAGPVRDRCCRLTNVPWLVSAAELERDLGIARASLVNDVAAMGHAVSALAPEDLLVLQAGRPDPAGNAALVALGTGFGTCQLHRRGNRFQPSPAESAHADFAARTDRQYEIVRALRERYGAVDVERVVSGKGLASLSAVLHAGPCAAMPADVAEAEVPALVTANALARRCPCCVEAFDTMVDGLAASLGNFALQTLATGGVYLGGGIPPRILDALRRPSFLATFRDKPAMADVLEAMPVMVILQPDAGLLGAAMAAAEL
jgi:glucokinase